MKWLRKLFGLCEHRWVVLESHPVIAPGAKLPFAHDYHLQCSVCGDIKARRL
jgi:hypothetical protein